ncbi:MAG: crosslink repair DNA glycosylase YcaQ family protein [Actinomycetota bacterium]|nr:crosslink repair DNA glycosylase YcaQ family protein [Actinomycetota bacterium]
MVAASPVELSEGQARAIAISAQGLDNSSLSTRLDPRHVRRAFKSIGVLQIDAVNTIARSHLLVLRARLGGSHDGLRDLLDRSAYQRRDLAEYWCHEASYLPVDDWPLFAWRMRRAEKGELWKGIWRFAVENPKFIAQVEQHIVANGAVSAGELQKRPPKTTWWGWSDAKIALEWLFWIGKLAVSKRENFTRYYDLSERVLPTKVFEDPPTETDAHLELLRRAALHLGVASAEDLVDYFRLPKVAGKERIKQLVESSDLLPVQVQGWDRTGYVNAHTQHKACTSRSVLLSPFDPLVWFRPRSQRLFNFKYRLEIYVPAHKRVHGYYVLPFLHNNELCARVDVKADVTTNTLQVPAAFEEPQGIDDVAVEALSAELRALAAWRKLEQIRVGQRGNLARRLRKALNAK